MEEELKGRGVSNSLSSYGIIYEAIKAVMYVYIYIFNIWSN